MHIAITVFIYAVTVNQFLLACLSMLVSAIERRAMISYVWRVLALRYSISGAYQIYLLLSATQADFLKVQNVIVALADFGLAVFMFLATERMLRRIPETLFKSRLGKEETAENAPSLPQLPTIINPQDMSSMVKHNTPE